MATERETDNRDMGEIEMSLRAENEALRRAIETLNAANERLEIENAALIERRYGVPDGI